MDEKPKPEVPPPAPVPVATHSPREPSEHGSAASLAAGVSLETMNLKRKHALAALVIGNGHRSGAKRSYDMLSAEHQRLIRTTMINSPRSLEVCGQEGVDPVVDLAFLEPKDLLLYCKGDREVATVRCEHHLKQREKTLTMLRKKRQDMIDAEVKARDDASKPAERPAPAEPSKAKAPAAKANTSATDDQSHPAPQRASTPVVKSTSALVGDLNPSRSTAGQPSAQANASVFYDDDDSEYDSEEERKRQAKEALRTPVDFRDAEAYKRHQEKMKEMKVLKQVEKI